ncbi:hypothetical protein [Microtetraspora sp. NBRC 16547]|uniref:hypothetical protein n=1 Tax=Microtetraspora sp. NBRC 16547 TaxID=3030993 RepID=UPI0024A04E3B|nr:hypothetical protein [Microtetraspora sp. NBRC 16547]GLW97639.1 hypothetical protein Misp02_17260 [Microtetraspora sp. NBRC 16547]
MTRTMPPAMPRVMTQPAQARTVLARAVGRTAVVALLVIAITACGVDPTRVFDGGPPPAISDASTLVRVYLVRSGRLEATSVAATSAHVNDVLSALFGAGRRPPRGVSTALSRMRLAQVQLVRYTRDPASHNDPDSAGLRLRVFVSGPRMSRIAMAQITCTARLRPEIWAVEIAQGEAGTLKIHTCREYWDLAPENGHLPP